VHNPTYKHGKLGSMVTKIVFITHTTHSKGYVIYDVDPNGGITKIISRNIDFPEDELSSVGEEEDLNSRQVTEDGTPPMSEGMEKFVCSRE